jgi:L-iditol 2-dehydrogenase
VRLRLRYCGLCGTDLFKLQFDAAEPGTVLGHEIVGTIDALGNGVRGFEPGDRVVVPHHVPCGDCPLCRRGSETQCERFRDNLLEPGGFSEFIRVGPRAVELALRRLPDAVADEAAVFLEPAACALRGIRRAGLPLDELCRVPHGGVACAVVLGAGSMGILHLVLLRALYPALRIVCSDLREDRLALAESLGATATSCAGKDHLESVVEDLSLGLGADVVFDTVGGPELLDLALGLTREGGTVVLFAHAADGARARFDINRLFKFERRVVGTYSGALKEQEAVFALLCRGGLDPLGALTCTLPLSCFGEAVERVRAGQALKVLLHPDEDG